MTLIEVLIVLALIALMMGAIVVGSGQLSSTKLRHSGAMITGAVRVGFARASASSKTVRLVLDFDENQIWLEEGDQPHLVQSKDLTGTGGAQAATQAEAQALEESSRIVKGPVPARARFTEIDAMGVAASVPGKGKKPLEGGIRFKSVQTAHDDQPRTNGRAYLYFWPGGQTERAVLTLTTAKRNEDGSWTEGGTEMTLVVAPLTGKVTVKDGEVPLAKPADDKEASEREDPGAF